MSEKKDGPGAPFGSMKERLERGESRLRGRTILITRPRAQSVEITSLFEGLGAEVIHLPTIEIVEPASWEAVDAAIDRLETYDWLILTSSNAARFFFGRVKDRLSGSLLSGARPKICAIGPATASAVEKAGEAVDLIPGESRAEGVLSSIIESLGGRERVRGIKFLIPRSKIAREELPAELTRLGAIVEPVEVYRTIKPESDCAAAIRQLREGAIHAITFTSPSTVANFASLLGVTNLSDLVGHALAGCIGPTTTAAAKEYGISRIIQPERYNASALVEAMAHSLVSEQ